jgi:hypothetical protein
MRTAKWLWQALETIPGLAAVRAEWETHLGADLACVERLLLRPRPNPRRTNRKQRAPRGWK